MRLGKLLSPPGGATTPLSLALQVTSLGLCPFFSPFQPLTMPRTWSKNCKRARKWQETAHARVASGSNKSFDFGEGDAPADDASTFRNPCNWKRQSEIKENVSNESSHSFDLGRVLDVHPSDDDAPHQSDKPSTSPLRQCPRNCDSEKRTLERKLHDMSEKWRRDRAYYERKAKEDADYLKRERESFDAEKLELLAKLDDAKAKNVSLSKDVEKFGKKYLDARKKIESNPCKSTDGGWVVKGRTFVFKIDD